MMNPAGVDIYIKDVNSTCPLGNLDLIKKLFCKQYILYTTTKGGSQEKKYISSIECRLVLLVCDLKDAMIENYWKKNTGIDNIGPIFLLAWWAYC